MPDEIPAAAAHDHLSVAEFQERCLQMHDMDGVILYSPRQRADSSCIFFKGGKCAIHSVKPFECRKVFGCESGRRHQRVREQMVQMVKTFQQ
jgi:Fe-S-cluster containining protein